MSLHADAVAVLSAWSPNAAGQEGLRQEYLAHLCTQPAGVWRECRPAHMTASGIVVDPDRTATMLVLHPRLGQWVQPGGHCEPDDASLAEAATREVREETGVQVISVSPAPVWLSRHPAPCPSGARWHLDVQYAVTVAGEAVPEVSAESQDVRWFAVDALPETLASGVADNVAAAIGYRADERPGEHRT